MNKSGEGKLKFNIRSRLEKVVCSFYVPISTLLILLFVVSNGACSSGGKSPANGPHKGGISMNNCSLGRLDFSLPKKFKLIGRSQSIYLLQVETIPLQGKSEKEIWDKRVKYLQAKHIANGYSLDTFKITEISPGFSAVFYKDNPSMPFSITVEAYKPVPGNIFRMEFTGETGKEDVMLRGIALTADDYRPNIANGFSIGAGSLISPPSKREHASAGFKDGENSMRLDVELNTAGSRLSKGPLENIDEEIQGLGAEGIKLKVLERRSRKAAGFNGEQALVELKDSEESSFRYTWFCPGETADSFKPEIRIQFRGSTENLEQATAEWNSIIDSLAIRKP